MRTAVTLAHVLQNTRVLISFSTSPVAESMEDNMVKGRQHSAQSTFNVLNFQASEKLKGCFMSCRNFTFLSFLDNSPHWVRPLWF